MSEIVKAALIVAATAIVCSGLFIYFSPYHTCVRDADGGNFSARVYCAVNSN
jgi:hypothetical protein